MNSFFFLSTNRKYKRLLQKTPKSLQNTSVDILLRNLKSTRLRLNTLKEYIEKQGFTKTEITEEVIEDYDVESFKLSKKDKTLHINFNVNEENE